MLHRERVTKRQLLLRLPQAGTAVPTCCRRPGSKLAASASVSVDDANDGERLAELAADSETGAVLFGTGAATMLVLPPFAIERDEDFAAAQPGALVELLERKRVLAVLLLRLGGYSVGFFRGETPIDTRTDQRFVKNRHRKGGQSQRRFERIREKQVRELFDAACEDAREKLTPYEREIEHVFFGGDRRTLADFRKRCDYFERFGERVMSRVLPVAGDPRRASLDVIAREIWSSDVWVVRSEANSG